MSINIQEVPVVTVLAGGTKLHVLLVSQNLYMKCHIFVNWATYYYYFGYLFQE